MTDLQCLCPGDSLNDIEGFDSDKKIILGPGLRLESERILVTKPGVLRKKEPNVYWIDSHQKRYIPARGESVIGIVASKAGDIFKIDVGGSEQATLSFLSFEGATKRNRPDVKIGDIVFAKFLVANKDMEPELVCIDRHGKSNGMGVIRDNGFLFHCSLNLIRKLLSPDCVLLKCLGESLPYETAIGMNGRVWVKGRSTKETIAIMNAVLSSEYMSNEQIKNMVRRLTDALAGF